MKCTEIVGVFVIEGRQLPFKISHHELERNSPEMLGHLLISRMRHAVMDAEKYAVWDGLAREAQKDLDNAHKV